MSDHSPNSEARRKNARPARIPVLTGFLLAAMVFLALGVQAPALQTATIPDSPAALSDRVVRYEIQAELNHAERTVRGQERVTWRNPSQDVVNELRLHLYLNAFKNQKSTFMKESGGRSRAYRFREGKWGYMDLEELRLADGTDLLAGAEFIHPDDDNADDETVLRVPLPEGVQPGGQLEFEAVFTSRLPQVFSRTGYRGDFYLVAQWYPKLGVYEPAGLRGREEGGWNCHQFHANSEFYADFGSFDVTITVPETFVVGATGKQAAPDINSAGKTTYRFVQDDVHDFAWTADPDFVKEVRTFSYAAERDPDEEIRMARTLGLDGSGIPRGSGSDLTGVPEEIRLGDVQVTVLLHPEHRYQMDRHFAAAFNAIKYFGYWYGRYPYENLTVVDPTYGGRGAGGMEYPTFITAGSAYFAPALKQRPEGVTIHEYGHQYWYGLVANNEFEEPWLDEGLNTYSTGKVLERAYGPDYTTMTIAGVTTIRFPLFSLPMDPAPGAEASGGGGLAGDLSRFFSLRWAGPSNDTLLNAFRDLPFLTFPADVPVPSPWDRRPRYLKGATKDQLVNPSWEFYDRDSYGLNSYSKTALMLRTLETLIGEESTLRGLRSFYQQYRFKHPSTDDFIQTMNAATDQDLTSFFDQTLFGSGILDYQIADISTLPVRPAAGIFGKGDQRKSLSAEDAAAQAKENQGEAQFELTLAVRRLGEVSLPVIIEITFEDGSTETREWDGRERWHRFTEFTDQRAVSARILPAEGKPLDVNWANDARTTEADRWPAIKWWTRLVGWAQNVLFFYSGLA